MKMQNDKKTSLGTDGIKAGEHTYNIIDVSSRYFGDMFLIMRDGEPYTHAPTALLAVNEVMNTI
ncbi:MAG: hypothetical protein PHX50_17490 [Massilibacteroides sp.]|nr:hypothetical protein [Massilibacteroides sp.]